MAAEKRAPRWLLSCGPQCYARQKRKPLVFDSYVLKFLLTFVAADCDGQSAEGLVFYSRPPVRSPLPQRRDAGEHGAHVEGSAQPGEGDGPVTGLVG